MVEFGYRLQRKKLVEALNEALARLEKAIKVDSKIDGICNDFCKAFEGLIAVNNPHTK